MARWKGRRETMANWRSYAVVATDDSIYMFGGIVGLDKPFEPGMPPVVRIYNCQSRQWYDVLGTYDTVADVPRAEYLWLGLHYGDKLLLWEGQGRAEPQRLFTFDIRTHVWTRPDVVAEPGLEIGRASYVLLDNVVYACSGGNYGRDRKELHVWTLDLITYKWSLFLKKPVFAIEDFCIGPSVAWNGKILTFALETLGSPLPEPHNKRAGQKVLRTVAVLNPRTKESYATFHVLGDTPIQINSNELMAYNGQVVSFNGYTLHEFNPERPDWTSTVLGRPDDAPVLGGKPVINEYGIFYVQRSTYECCADELYAFSSEVPLGGTALCKSVERGRN